VGDGLLDTLLSLPEFNTLTKFKIMCKSIGLHEIIYRATISAMVFYKISKNKHPLISRGWGRSIRLKALGREEVYFKGKVNGFNCKVLLQINPLPTGGTGTLYSYKLIVRFYGKNLTSNL